MSESNTFQLEHFYFGNLTASGNRTSASAGIVARTPNITTEQATESVQLAKLRPPLPAEVTEHMQGALGLFKGGTQSADYIIAKAQRNSVGLPQVQFYLTPLTVLQKLGGNVLTLGTLAKLEMPSFSKVEPDLKPFELAIPASFTAEEQNAELLNLLLICDDSFADIRSMLAGIVQGWPLAIVNSPPSFHERLRFLQGLLCLLPAPARIGITFATHVSDFSTSQAQVKFASLQAVPPKHVVYDWENKKLLTDPPQDAYSHYITSQLRLETTHVVQETDRLARTAVWRAMQRENLAKALEWVSRRAALDLTVRDGQPADRHLVAAVLREDPTLPDDLRHIYVRHVLAFALALKEAESADVVAAQCASHPDLTQGVAEQLNTALENDQALLVYSLLERWILRVPECTVEQWQPLLHQAAKSHLNALLTAKQTEPALNYLNYLRQTPPTLRITTIMSELLQRVSEASYTDTELAHRIFLLAAEFMASGDLYHLISDTQFIDQLPDSLQTTLTYLQAESPPKTAPPNLLNGAAMVFGDGYRMLVMTRLVELAIMQQRADLIDTQALQALLVMVQSRRSEQFHTLIHHVVDDLSELERLQKLDAQGKRILIQLTLQTHDYAHAIALLEYYQNTVFGAEEIDEFTALVGELFRQVLLPTEELSEALSHLESSQIRPGPRAMIYTSALINRQWDTELDYAAKRLTTIVFNDYNLISVIGSTHILRLLEYHAKPRNALDTLRVAAALTDYVVYMDTSESAALITRMWPLVTWDAEVTGTAQELLRRYIRGVPMRQAPEMINYIHNELGAEIGAMLHATYIVRFIINDADLLQFVEDLHIATELLIDIATVYHANKDLPTNVRLRRDIDTMTGGLTDQGRHQIAENMLNIQAKIHELGMKRTRIWSKSADYDQFVQGKNAPQNSLELLHFIGGHFGEHETSALSLEREEMAHLFGTRSAAMFLRESNILTNLLQGLSMASKQLESKALAPLALGNELNSLWDTLSLYHKRQVQEQLARDCQHLANVIEIIAQNGNERALGNTSIGRQLESGKRQPQTALETMRWIHGYFARKHLRA